MQTMLSAFSSYAVQSAVEASPTNPNPNIWKHKKYAEFMLYKLPNMLESHASSPVSRSALSTQLSSPCYKHMRQRSFHIETVGIISNNNVKTVSFGVPCTLVYKRESR